MKTNPYYDESLENDCRNYMLIGIRLWMKYIEKHPEMVPSSSVLSINNLLEIIDNFNENTQTREIAILYEGLIGNFISDNEVTGKLLKLPILFLVPELK